MTKWRKIRNLQLNNFSNLSSSMWALLRIIVWYAICKKKKKNCCQSSYVISRQKLLKSKIQKHTIDGNTKFYYPTKSQLNRLKIEKLVWKRSLFDDSADPGCLWRGWRLTVNPTETLLLRLWNFVISSDS